MMPPTLYAQLNALKITKAEADTQYNLLLNGAVYCVLSKPATLGDGILAVSIEEAKRLAQFYKNTNSNLKIQKFVPASGAATRMFKDLVEFNAFGKLTPSIKQLINGLNKLAFFHLIPSNLAKDEAVKYIISTLKYNKVPKGLIPFHTYKNTVKTAFEEHWLEAALYATNYGQARAHFTVSPQHQQAFTQLEKKMKPSFEIEKNTQLNISYSNQKASTNTLCIDATNSIVLNTDGSPLLRPGGHGALIQNLNALEADLVFIKNIDNVVHQSHIETTVIYKQALAGKLIELKNAIFKQLRAIDDDNYLLFDLESLGKDIFIIKPDGYTNWSEATKVEFWKGKFNRPIRVSGMVKNEGEPGGGPFWVKGKNGLSLQIVESDQIDTTDTNQQSILQQSTHFNPVDLVCQLTDYKENRFDLRNYIDESAAFITSKTVNGQEVKVLERPGLWNGAMADWITLFVEVPIETFNPVKTINDLLKSAHLS